MNTRGHIKGKRHTHVPNVGTASDRAHIPVGINKSIKKRNIINVPNMRRPVVFPTILGIRESIKGRDPIHVKNVRKASNGALTSLNIREPTPGRSLMNVLSVGNASVRVRPSLYTRELTLEKDLINVLNVGKALDRVHTLFDTKGSTEIKPHHFDMILHELFPFILLLP